MQTNAVADSGSRRLIMHSATWPNSYPMTRYWAEGTALYGDALDSVSEAEQLPPALWARVEARRVDWAMLMLRAAHVLKAGRVDDWRSFATTGSALIDSRELPTILIMAYVLDVTSAAWLAARPHR